MELKQFDIFTGTQSSNPSSLTNINGTLFFVASDGTYGEELWKYDGTTTRLVKDINPGINNSSPLELVQLNNLLYFVATDSSGIRLWQSDGTEQGTRKIADNVRDPYNLTPIDINGQKSLVFAADGANGYELYISNGTASGTRELFDIYPGARASFPFELTLVNINGKDTIFFTAENDLAGIELWRTDGTQAGTFQVKDINPGTVSSNPFNLANVNGTLYFSADNGTNGYELWKSDGTANGTSLVRDINPSAGSDPDSLTNVNGILYFTADNGTNGSEVWKSNGTTTELVRDINPGTVSSDPSNLTNVNGTLYFVANNGSNGRELWKSDGTTTELVKDINPGTVSSNPSNLTNINGTLYFAADNGSNGNELWKSDGTNAGTVLVNDLRQGIGSSNPNNLTLVNNTLYFGADIPLNGNNIGTELSSFSGFLSPVVEYYRFRNKGFTTGTYLFTGKQERDAILANPSFNQTFELEGNGAAAFKASEQTGDGLLPFYRLQSRDVPGTYLFVGPQEYNAIFAIDSPQNNKWNKEGLDSAGNDIAEFYLYGVGAKRGTEYNRFQNRENGTYIFTGPQETTAILSDPNLSNAFINQGVAFEAFA